MGSMKLIHLTKILSLVFLYLKVGPVHGHAGAVDVEEPLQIILRAGRCDRVFELSVHHYQTVRKTIRC